MINAVIFDMDGVLINSEPLHFQAERQLLARYGKELTPEVHAQLIGTTEEHTWNYLIGRFRLQANNGQLKTEKAAIYHAILENYCPSVPGAVQLVDCLKTHLPLALASSSDRSDIDIVLSKLGIKGNFRVIVSGDEIRHGKPHPEIYLTAAQRLGIKPQECLAIEDAVNGIASAKSAGMKVVAVTTSFPRGKLADANYIIDGLHEFNMGWLG